MKPACDAASVLETQAMERLPNNLPVSDIFAAENAFSSRRIYLVGLEMSRHRGKSHLP